MVKGSGSKGMRVCRAAALVAQGKSIITESAQNDTRPRNLFYNGERVSEKRSNPWQPYRPQQQRPQVHAAKPRATISSMQFEQPSHPPHDPHSPSPHPPPPRRLLPAKRPQTAAAEMTARTAEHRVNQLQLQLPARALWCLTALSIHHTLKTPHYPHQHHNPSLDLQLGPDCAAAGPTTAPPLFPGYTPC